MKMKKIVFIVALIALVSACSSEKASFAYLETQRQTAIDNAEFLARTYRASYAPKAKIKSRGDSAIKDTCPTGDGWATIDLLDAESGAKAQELKCSTYSATTGCMTSVDFATRYKDGQCDKSIPNPLPKVIN